MGLQTRVSDVRIQPKIFKKNIFGDFKLNFRITNIFFFKFEGQVSIISKLTRVLSDNDVHDLISLYR